MTTNTILISLFAAALSAALLSAQPGRQEVAANPLATNAINVANGQRLFNQTCQTCHGSAGQGSDRGPSLARTALTHGNADADVFRAIRAGTQMPPSPALSDTEVWQLVTYIRTHYSPFEQITTANVARLRSEWATPVRSTRVA